MSAEANEPIGCDEFGNGCGCRYCMAEVAAREKLAAEWAEALAPLDLHVGVTPSNQDTE